MSFWQSLYMMSPYILSLLTVIAVGIIYSIKNFTGNYIKLIFYFIPVWILSIIVLFTIPNHLDGIVVPAKIISFFLPVIDTFWISYLIKRNKNIEENQID
ncbi:MAG TPA: hypothetical protein VIK77_01885 [Tissierellaceae bacterium]